MTHDPRALRNWLTNTSGSLAVPLSHSDRLFELTLAIRERLAEPWTAAVRVANLRDDVVVMYCENAAAMTRLRYRQGELLALIEARLGIACRHLEAKIKPLPSRFRKPV